MRDELPQNYLHSSPPRPPLSLISLPSSTLSSFILTPFFKHETLAEIWSWRVFGVEWKREPFQHFIVVLVISLTSGNIIVLLIQCHFYQNRSMTLKSSWVIAGVSWDLTAGVWRNFKAWWWRDCHMKGRTYSTATRQCDFSAKLINRTTESSLSDQQQQLFLLFSTSYVP